MSDDFIVDLKNALRKYEKRNMNSDYIVDISHYLDDFLVPIKQVFEEISVYLRRIIEKWQKEPLPLFSVIATPRSNNWFVRLKEEFKIFDILVERHEVIYGTKFFDHLKQIDERGIKLSCYYLDPSSNIYRVIEIRIPIRYPYTRPVSSLDEFGSRCLSGKGGGLDALWRKDGRWGIAHYLAYILGPLIGLDKGTIRLR